MSYEARFKQVINGRLWMCNQPDDESGEMWEATDKPWLLVEQGDNPNGVIGLTTHESPAAARQYLSVSPHAPVEALYDLRSFGRLDPVVSYQWQRAEPRQPLSVRELRDVLNAITDDPILDQLIVVESTESSGGWHVITDLGIPETPTETGPWSTPTLVVGRAWDTREA